MPHSTHWQVIGAVTLGKRSSVWYSAVLRGDVNAIVIGENSNIQDRTVPYPVL
jgi:carbonic anhydrase/acetyltransferase-like protein (isoleucine patch superfamily)